MVVLLGDLEVLATKVLFKLSVAFLGNLLTLHSILDPCIELSELLLHRYDSFISLIEARCEADHDIALL